MSPNAVVTSIDPVAAYRWNDGANEFNQWDALGQDEKMNSLRQSKSCWPRSNQRKVAQFSRKKLSNSGKRSLHITGPRSGLWQYVDTISVSMNRWGREWPASKVSQLCGKYSSPSRASVSKRAGTASFPLLRPAKLLRPLVRLLISPRAM